MFIIEKAPKSIFGRKPIEQERKVLQSYADDIMMASLIANPEKFSGGLLAMTLHPEKLTGEKERAKAEAKAREILKNAKYKLHSIL